MESIWTRTYLQDTALALCGLFAALGANMYASEESLQTRDEKSLQTRDEWCSDTRTSRTAIATDQRHIVYAKSKGFQGVRLLPRKYTYKIRMQGRPEQDIVMSTLTRITTRADKKILTINGKDESKNNPARLWQITSRSITRTAFEFVLVYDRFICDNCFIAGSSYFIFISRKKRLARKSLPHEWSAWEHERWGHPTFKANLQTMYPFGFRPFSIQAWEEQVRTQQK